MIFLTPKRLALAFAIGELFSIQSAKAAEATAPNLDELLGVLRSNLTVKSDLELNAAAVRGLLDQLDGSVLLESPGSTPARPAGLKQAELHDGNIGYWRIGSITPGLADDLRAAFDAWKSTNALKGLILDLRFADGTEYAAAAKVADRFLASEKALMNFGQGMARSTAKKDAWTMPVVALVNERTRGAAESLAAVLRQTEAALLIGSSTSGHARVYKDFTLSTGHKIKVASGAIQLGDGRNLPPRGVTPDISVTVSKENEAAWFEDAFKDLNPSASARPSTNSLAGVLSTNRQARRINEAELVRLRKEGRDPDSELTETPPAERDTAKPIVRDPVLARALDLLKALAVVQQQRGAQ